MAVPIEKAEHRNTEAFFARIVDLCSLRGTRPAAVVVTHVLPDRPHFFRALGALMDIELVIPKPRSKSPEMMAQLAESGIRLSDSTRDQLAHPKMAVEVIASSVGDARPFVLLDIGGYFAPALPRITEVFGERLLCVVEDTENGHQRYERVLAEKELGAPVYSVARSPLKETEDYLVGQAVVHAFETLVRRSNHIMQGREAAVIGYGKIGRSVASQLASQRIRTSVVEIDPVRKVQAISHGFRVLGKDEALASCGLIICATGNNAIEKHDWRKIGNGAFVGSVTSSDDELDLEGLQASYVPQDYGVHVEKWSDGEGAYLFLMNGGNAVNFVENAVVGTFIYLVQSEIIAAVAEATGIEERRASSVILEVSQPMRSRIASAWIEEFGLGNENRPQ